MIRRPIELLGALLLCATAAADAAAPDCSTKTRDALGAIHSRGTLRVAQTNDYRPFSYRDAAGSPTGIDSELAKRLATELGVELVWIDTTWSTLAEDLRNDRYDIAMSGVSITQDRAAIGCFSTPYFVTGKTALTRCAVQRRFDTVAAIDAADVTVIVNRGGTNERFARDHLTRARIVVRDDNRSVFTALAAGEADLMITDAVEARIEAQANPALCVAEPPPLFESVEKAYLIPQDPAFKARIDAWLTRIRASGALSATLDRFLPTAPERH